MWSGEKSHNGLIEVHGLSHYLLSELDDQRQLVGLDKSQECFFRQLSIKGIAPFIKLQKKNMGTFGYRYYSPF